MRPNIILTVFTITFVPHVGACCNRRSLYTVADMQLAIISLRTSYQWCIYSRLSHTSLYEQKQSLVTNSSTCLTARQHSHNRRFPSFRLPPRPPRLCDNLNPSSQLMWSSYSTAPAAIPSSALFYATPISGSPYDISVVPGAASYPYSEAFGEGVAHASAGVPSSFVIQAKVLHDKQSH